MKIIKQILYFTGIILTILLLTLSAILCLSIEWMFNTWTNLSMDELIFHLEAPLVGTNKDMIKEYVNVCIAPAILLTLLIFVLFIAWHKKKRYIIMFGGIMIMLSFFLSGIKVYSAYNKLDIKGYVENQGTESTFIEDNYVSAMDVKITFPERKRNLIYIFLESIEVTYADKDEGGGFKENMIPKLTQISIENENFSGENGGLNGAYAMPYTIWTSGAMFAHTSGLPLQISIGGNNMDTQDSFFAGAVSLGDILQQAGYSQTLMIGSDATFGGRRLYFTEHGNYDIFDYNYAIEEGILPEDYRVWWGYEDQKLFEYAKEKLVELSNENEPFNLTLLTVDTHAEDGYFCELCQEKYVNNPYANIVICADKQVERFVKWIQQQDFYENTTIVLVGDHPTMNTYICSDVEDEYVRKVYTAYINSAVEVKNNSKREYTTFDYYPTTLAALGVEIEGNRLGLGTNLFSSTQTLTERYGLEIEEQELNKNSHFMEKLADIDINDEELLKRQGVLPTANIEVGIYEYENGILPVYIKDILNVEENIDSVLLAVWTNEDQSDLQWIQMEYIEDNNCYYIGINPIIFDYKTGEYHMEGYIVDSSGERNKVSEAIGIIE